MKRGAAWALPLLAALVTVGCSPSGLDASDGDASSEAGRSGLFSHVAVDVFGADTSSSASASWVDIDADDDQSPHRPRKTGRSASRTRYTSPPPFPEACIRRSHARASSRLSPLRTVVRSLVTYKFSPSAERPGAYSRAEEFTGAPKFSAGPQSPSRGNFSFLGGFMADYRRFQGVGALGRLMGCSSYATPERLTKLEAQRATTLLGAARAFPFPDICDVVHGAAHSDELFLSSPAIGERIRAFLAGEDVDGASIAVPFDVALPATAPGQ